MTDKTCETCSKRSQEKHNLAMGFGIMLGILTFGYGIAGIFWLDDWVYGGLNVVEHEHPMPEHTHEHSHSLPEHSHAHDHDYEMFWDGELPEHNHILPNHEHPHDHKVVVEESQ